VPPDSDSEKSYTISFGADLHVKEYYMGYDLGDYSKSTPMDLDGDGWNNSIEDEVGTGPKERPGHST